MFDEMTLAKLERTIAEALSVKKSVIIGIDGRCASGKTSLAEELSRRLGCGVVHTDDFYLECSQRTAERLNEPGGNLDRERLLDEVLVPLKNGEEVVYRPFVCSVMSFSEAIRLGHKRIFIVEGSYSCHPELRDSYDITVFVTTDKKTQHSRILCRNGEEKLQTFLSKWIPMEEKYFAAFDTQNSVDLVIET